MLPSLITVLLSANDAGISARPVTLDTASGDLVVLGRVDPEAIRAVFRRGRGPLELCAEPARVSAFTVQAELTAGRLDRVTTTSTPKDAKFDACVSERVKSWSFPKPPPGTTVVFVFPLSLRQGAPNSPGLDDALMAELLAYRDGGASTGQGGLGLRGSGCPGDGSGLELDSPEEFPASAADVRAATAACAAIQAAKPAQRLAVAARACGTIGSCGARCPAEIAAWGRGERSSLAQCDDVRCSAYEGRETEWLRAHLRAYLARVGIKERCGL